MPTKIAIVELALKNMKVQSSRIWTFISPISLSINLYTREPIRPNNQSFLKVVSMKKSGKNGSKLRETCIRRSLKHWNVVNWKSLKCPNAFKFMGLTSFLMRITGHGCLRLICHLLVNREPIFSKNIWEKCLKVCSIWSMVKIFEIGTNWMMILLMNSFI